MAQSNSVSEIRPRFRAGINGLQEYAQSQVAAILEHADPKQPPIDKNNSEDETKPAGWNGDLTDWEGISRAFTREELEQDFLAVINPASPGVSGDYLSISLQGDWLATQERAFRSRHQTPTRAWLHALGRRRGHGHKAGVIENGLLRYVENILQVTKNKRTDTAV